MISRFRDTGLAVNRFFEKHLLWVISASLMLGFLFYPAVSPWAKAVPWLFAYITFIMALDCGWRQFVGTLRFPLPIMLTLLVAHGLAPWLAFKLGSLVFGPESPYVIGLVLFTIIPFGVSSVIWVGLAGGHVPLALSLIVIDSLLSPLLVPGLLRLYFGRTIEFDTAAVMQDLLLIIVLPTILGVLVNAITRGQAKPWSAPVTLPLSRLAFAAVIMLNAAVIAPHVLDQKSAALLLFLAAVGLTLIGYGLGFVGGRLLGKPELVKTVAFLSGMRNVSLGIVIGNVYFGPAAALPVVLTILIQQPVATLMQRLFARGDKRG